jgi:hypothetical protein
VKNVADSSHAFISVLIRMQPGASYKNEVQLCL